MICGGDGDIEASDADVYSIQQEQHQQENSMTSNYLVSDSGISSSPSPPRSPPAEPPKWLDESVPLTERIFMATSQGDALFARSVLSRPEVRGRDMLYSIRNEDQETLLHVAARVANFEVARILIGSTESAPPPGYIDHRVSNNSTTTFCNLLLITIIIIIIILF